MPWCVCACVCVHVHAKLWGAEGGSGGRGVRAQQVARIHGRWVS